ncbi:MAG: lipopolysaccharide biosynthesis protein [Sulfuriferula sp.]
MKRFGLWLGIDRAVLFTLLARGWNVGAGLLTIVFVTRFLSPELQGYYFTFYSLIALQIFAEMGLNFAIIQFASHEMAKLAWTEDGTVSGIPEAKRRLQSLMHFAVSWFGVGALLMVAVLLPVGIYFFNTAATKGVELTNVGVPWSLLVVFTAVNLMITAAAALLEGCGKVAHVAVMRLVQLMFSVSAVWIVLSLGGNLYALAVNGFMTVLVGTVWLWSKYRSFFMDLFSHSTSLPGINWRSEIWPFQWRIALSWLSGYLIFQFFTPLIFKTHGPIEAGKMGMSMQIIGAMNGTAMAWITTKAPTFGKLIATKQIKALDTLFFRALAHSFYFLLLGVVCVWLGLFYLTTIASPYATRVLPLPLFSLLLLISLANQIVFAEAAYLRAYKQEPFMVLSVLTGMTTAILALIFVPRFGAAGAIYAYTATAVVIGLGGGTVIFIRKRKEWAEIRNNENIMLGTSK